MAKETSSSKDDRIKWQAEDIVRRSLENTPGYKKTIRQAMKDIRAAEKQAKKTLKGK